MCTFISALVFQRLFVVLFLCATLLSGYGCSTRQLQVVSTGLLVADWQQTLVTTRNPNKFYEKNKILGKHPSESRVNVYFGTACLGNILVGELAPEGYSKWFYYGVIALESVVVYRNIQVGIRF